MTVRAFRIPKHDEDPSEDMIEFLNENPHPWDGDDSGIVLNEDVIGAPGDWVLRDDGIYSIKTHKWMKEHKCVTDDDKRYDV